MNRLLTILFAIASISASAQMVLTLDQAISAALEHNHDLFIAGLDAEKASNSATYGNAGMLPSVTATAGTNYSNQNSNLVRVEGVYGITPTRGAFGVPNDIEKNQGTKYKPNQI